LWSRWCEAEGHPVFLFPDDLPKSRETFFAFLVDQRDIRKNAANTLTGKKAAISFRFKYFNFPDPTQWFLIDQFLKGVRKSDGGTAVIRKLPVGRRHLLEARGRCRLDARWGTALWASLMLGYFFVLRANNCAAPDAKDYDPGRVISRQDVAFFAGTTRVLLTTTTAPSITSVRLRIKSTKTDQLGKGFERDMYTNSDAELCVVKALVQHLLLTSNLPDDWPIAAYDPDRGGRTKAGGVIKRKHMADILKAAGKALGESMEGFGSHSLRIGGATALHMQGVPDSWIMWFGNWSSPTYLIYCRASSSMSLDFSEKMASADARVQQGDVDEQALRQSIPLYGGRKAF